MVKAARGAPSAAKAAASMLSKKPSDTDMLVSQLERMAGRLENEMEEIEPQKLDCVRRLQRYACKVLFLPGFDYVMGGIILFNLFVMVIDVDRSASQEEPSESSEKSVYWTEVFGWIVLVIFILELLMRILAFGWSFWGDPWNIADFVIVLVDVIFSVIGILADDIFPVSILRVFRLSKLARVSKVLRVFPELKMLLAGLVHSLKAVFWGALLLFLFLLVFAMIAVLLIHPLNSKIDHGECDRCSRAFSSVIQASLTFWQQIVTGDSWGLVTIPIMEQYPSTAFFFLPTFLCIGLSVMNLMLAVVVNQAQAAYENEMQEMQTDRALKTLSHHTRVLQICQGLDYENSGQLSHDRLYASFQEDGAFADAMHELGISESDFDFAWQIIDTHKTGAVSYKEFVGFLLTMSNNNTEFLLTYLKNYITWIKSSLGKQLEMAVEESKALEQSLEAKIDKAVERVEEDIEEVEEEVEEGKEEIEEAIHEQNVGVRCKTHQEKRENTVVDIDSKAQLCVTKDSDACQAVKLGVTSASMRDTVQDILQELNLDIGRMHLELKDMLVEMKEDSCEKLLSLCEREMLIMQQTTQRVVVCTSGRQPAGAIHTTCLV